jgi:hypothetical protein
MSLHAFLMATHLVCSFAPAACSAQSPFASSSTTGSRAALSFKHPVLTVMLPHPEPSLPLLSCIPTSGMTQLRSLGCRRVGGGGQPCIEAAGARDEAQRRLWRPCGAVGRRPHPAAAEAAGGARTASSPGACAAAAAVTHASTAGFSSPRNLVSRHTPCSRQSAQPWPLPLHALQHSWVLWPSTLNGCAGQLLEGSCLTHSRCCASGGACARRSGCRSPPCARRPTSSPKRRAPACGAACAGGRPLMLGPCSRLSWSNSYPGVCSHPAPGEIARTEGGLLSAGLFSAGRGRAWRPRRG